MVSEDEEIQHLIHATFFNSAIGHLPFHELVRMWTLDMQWMNPDSAPAIIDALCQTGWLQDNDGEISPNPSIAQSPPPFGWKPILRSLTDPPVFSAPATVGEIANDFHNEQKSHVKIVTNQEYPPDWAEANIRPLISWISLESGLTQKEVVRRAQRKRRALGPVTLWMALSLVSREQGLDMNVVTELIGEPN